MGLEVKALQVRLHDVHEFRHRLADVAKGEIDERAPYPPHRVQHAHRALHDIGEVLPADISELRSIGLIEVYATLAKAVRDGASDYAERRPDRGGNGLHQRGLAAA